MQREEITALFDDMAASYDQQWGKLSPIHNALHLLIGSIFSAMPDNARILCVGAGTGAELIYLAQSFPRYAFTVVEPSGPMLQICRDHAEEHGFISRCVFHQGYLDSLPPSPAYDAATAVLVSQFILDQETRTGFFQAIAQRLKPSGLMVSADLSSDVSSAAYQSLLEVWLKMMSAADIPAEGIERMRAAYERDVGVLPVETVSGIIQAGGFEAPTPFFQAGLIHGWYAKHTSAAT